MNTTEDAQKFATEQSISEQKAAHYGTAEKSKNFEEIGIAVFSKVE